MEYVLGERRLLVVCNAVNEAKTVNLPAAYQNAKVSDKKSGETVTLSSTLSLSAYEYKIYQLN